MKDKPFKPTNGDGGKGGKKKSNNNKKKQPNGHHQKNHHPAAAASTNGGLSVYKRIPVLPPPFSTAAGAPTNRFLEPTDPHYQEVVSKCYQGFVVDDEGCFPSTFHHSFMHALEALEQAGMFLFDLTQPAGLNTKVARTFVTRCLVGEPGITYKYLGLRMFAYPWTKGEAGATPAMVTIGQLNQALIKRTLQLLRETEKKVVGSCQYNLTLINRCFPDGQVVKLKDEPTFGKDHCTVSWHADSTLEHYSSIAVYHCTKEKGGGGGAAAVAPLKKGGGGGNGSQWQQQQQQQQQPGGVGKEKKWRIALRVYHNAEGPLMGKANLLAANKAFSTSVPALATPLPSKAAYYLLDDFNHHHQHSVLAGSTDRYASTHRVCRTEGHTFASIVSRCKRALHDHAAEGGLSAKQLRAEQSALNEVEFEWIRQMYIQGQLHYDLHTWWHQPMQELLDLWAKLAERINAHLAVLHDAVGGLVEAEKRLASLTVEQEVKKFKRQLAKRRKRCEAVELLTFDTMIEGLGERHSKREGWHAREKAPAFQTVPPNCRPMAIPFPAVSTSGDYFVSDRDEGRSTSTPLSLHPDSPASQAAMEGLIKQLRQMKETYVKGSALQRNGAAEGAAAAAAAVAAAAAAVAAAAAAASSTKAIALADGQAAVWSNKAKEKVITRMIHAADQKDLEERGKDKKRKKKKKKKRKIDSKVGKGKEGNGGSSGGPETGERKRPRF